MTSFKYARKPEPLRCPGCGALCADPETLVIHKKFCPKMSEQRKKETRIFEGRSKR
jgi:hypothetical protein